MARTDQHALLRPFFLGGQFIHLSRGFRAYHEDVAKVRRTANADAAVLYRVGHDVAELRRVLASVAVKGGEMERMLTVRGY